MYPSFQLTVLPENMSKFQMKPLASSRINLPHNSFIVEVRFPFAPAQYLAEDQIKGRFFMKTVFPISDGLCYLDNKDWALSSLPEWVLLPKHLVAGHTSTGWPDTICRKWQASHCPKIYIIINKSCFQQQSRDDRFSFIEDCSSRAVP